MSRFDYLRPEKIHHAKTTSRSPSAGPTTTILTKQCRVAAGGEEEEALRSGIPPPPSTRLLNRSFFYSFLFFSEIRRQQEWQWDFFCAGSVLLEYPHFRCRIIKKKTQMKQPYKKRRVMVIRIVVLDLENYIYRLLQNSDSYFAV